MTEPVQIRGALMPDPRFCRFYVDRPLLEEGWTVAFATPVEAAGSTLAEALFAVPGICEVQVRDQEITLRKDSTDPWPELAGRVIAAMREALGGEGPLVSRAALEKVRSVPTEDIAIRVNRLFEEHINPALASHGGFARVVKVKDRDVYLEMGGGCQGCAAAQATLRMGIETAIRRAVPQVREVVDVTDHGAGGNPYFRT